MAYKTQLTGGRRGRGLFVALISSLVACSAVPTNPGEQSSAAGPGGATGAGGAHDGGLPGTGGAGGGGVDFDASTDGGPAAGEVYAHDTSTLYLLEPISKVVSVVGT